MTVYSSTGSWLKFRTLPGVPMEFVAQAEDLFRLSLLAEVVIEDTSGSRRSFTLTDGTEDKPTIN